MMVTLLELLSTSGLSHFLFPPPGKPFLQIHFLDTIQVYTQVSHLRPFVRKFLSYQKQHSCDAILLYFLLSCFIFLHRTLLCMYLSLLNTHYKTMYLFTFYKYIIYYINIELFCLFVYLHIICLLHQNVIPLRKRIFCLLPNPQQVEQCLSNNRLSTNICSLNEYIVNLPNPLSKRISKAELQPQILVFI